MRGRRGCGLEDFACRQSKEGRRARYNSPKARSVTGGNAHAIVSKFENPPKLEVVTHKGFFLLTAKPIVVCYVTAYSSLQFYAGTKSED